MARKIVVKQVRSSIGSNPVQKKTLRALGLRKINAVKEHENNRVIQGMISKVRHLIEINEK
jgi:large subunit ribosomal protein L30